MKTKIKNLAVFVSGTGTNFLAIQKEIINKNIKKINARTIFVKGPASDIFPFLSFVVFPAITTAPGAAIMKPTKDNRIARNNAG